MTAHELDVSIYDRHAGTIRRDGGRITLSYTPAYRTDPASTPLSLALPLTATEHSNRTVEAYLRGLLPDNDDVRRRWARKHGVKDRDTLGLIAAIGLDVAGAARFTVPEFLDLAGDSLTPLGDADIAARLRALREDDSDWSADPDLDEHWSLAGAQGKFALVRVGDGWAVPEGRRASTHIIKPGISRISAQALSEHVSMRTLALAGLDVAQTEYREFADQPAIVVTRYDRLTTPDGRVRRIHQEDLIQTFGLDPSKKYEADGGPGVARIADRLRSATDDDSLDRFIRAVIGNYVLGAPDAHARNYSLLLVGPTARLAPLYDVATGLIADSAGRLPWTRTAMSIGGERRFGEVEAKHWERFARAVGLDPEQVRRAVRQLAASIPEGFADAVAELPPRAAGATMLREDVLPRIAALAKRTLTGLDSSAREAGRVTRPFVSELETQGSAGPERRWDSR